jgi:hypothetical protein
MKKVIKLTESQLNDVVKKVINEQMEYKSLRPCKPGDKGTLVKQRNIFALSSGSPFCKVVTPTSNTVHSNQTPQNRNAPKTSNQTPQNRSTN